MRPGVFDRGNGRECHRQRALAQKPARIAVIGAMSRHFVRAGLVSIMLMPRRLRRRRVMMPAAVVVPAVSLGRSGGGGGGGAQHRGVGVRMFVREPAEDHGEEIPRQDQPPQAALSHSLDHAREPSGSATLSVLQ
jgi:hypothetical protein